MSAPRTLYIGWLIVSLSLCISCDSPLKPTTTRLQIVNSGDADISELAVLFPNERVRVGGVPAYSTAGFVPVAKGVYAFAAFEFAVAGQPVQQPVLDWTNEKPLDGADFQYVVSLETGTGGPTIAIKDVVRLP